MRSLPQLLLVKDEREQPLSFALEATGNVGDLAFRGEQGTFLPCIGITVAEP
jgi:hypothetical protein